MNAFVKIESSPFGFFDAGTPRDTGAVSVGPANFRGLFAASRRVPLSSYENALFFECASLRVLLVTLVCDTSHVALFAADRVLIDRVASARSLAEVDREISDFWSHPENDRWVRRVLRLRLSSGMLRKIAAELLPTTTVSPTA